MHGPDETTSNPGATSALPSLRSASITDCIRTLFAKYGLRCTRQRLAIYEALRGAKHHPTADELFRIVKPRTDQLSRATVYNALEALCEVGLVRKMPTMNGCCCYDADTAEHPHIRFTDTDEILDVPGDLGAKLVDELPRDVLEQIEKAFGAHIEQVNIQLIARRNGSGEAHPVRKPIKYEAAPGEPRDR